MKAEERVNLVMMATLGLFVLGIIAAMKLVFVDFVPDLAHYQDFLLGVLTSLWIAPAALLIFLKIGNNKRRNLTYLLLVFMLFMSHSCNIFPRSSLVNCTTIETISYSEFLLMCDIQPSGRGIYKASLGKISMELVEVLW